MRLLLTGAAGFIGSHLAERLAEDGHDVLGVDAFPHDVAAPQRDHHAALLREKGVEVRRVDLAEDALGDLLDGAEGVVHLAAQTGLRDVPAEAYERNNVLATRRLVAAATRVPALKAFVHASTSSVYGALATGEETAPTRPASAYGHTKLAAEQIVQGAAADGLPACVVRLYSVYGPRDRPDKLVPRLLRALDGGAPFPLHAGSAEHRRSYTFVDDAVEGLVRVLDRIETCRGETLNLGYPVPATTAEAIGALEALVGRCVPMVEVPARAGDQVATQAHIGRARALLGFQPATPLRDGLAAMLRARQAADLASR